MIIISHHQSSSRSEFASPPLALRQDHSFDALRLGGMEWEAGATSVPRKHLDVADGRGFICLLLDTTPHRGEVRAMTHQSEHVSLTMVTTDDGYEPIINMTVEITQVDH